MPQYCAALGCVNKRTVETKAKRITFHKFPKEKFLRRQWEVAARKRGFSATKSSVLCSEHFKPEDIDATGQTVRIREGAKPSVFSFQSPVQKQVFTRTTQTSKKARESVASVASKNVPQTESPPPQPSPLPDVGSHLFIAGKPVIHKLNERPHAGADLGHKSNTFAMAEMLDHCYALPASPAGLKARLTEALARVEGLERELRNVKDRERRAKNTVFGLLEDLRGMNLINEELREKLDSYSGLPVHLLSKQGNDYTRDQREFALTLHLHGPKAYNYLRKSLHLQLPHPHTLQRWMSSVDDKPGLDSVLEKSGEQEDECETLADTESDIQQNIIHVMCLKDVDTVHQSEDNTGVS